MRAGRACIPAFVSRRTAADGGDAYSMRSSGQSGYLKNYRKFNVIGQVQYFNKITASSCAAREFYGTTVNTK
jgi:hypothetical protein